MTQGRMRHLWQWGGVVCCVYLACFFARLIFSQVDYYQVDNFSKPIFATETMALGDGGTTIYRGFGYKITAHCQMNSKNTYYRYGPKLEYPRCGLLFPLPSVEHIRIVSEEELTEKR